MRLLDTESFEVLEFVEGSIPAYAILSHTWGPDEVSLQEFRDKRRQADRDELESLRGHLGWAKVLDAADLASNNGHRYIWIDTCCIDKTSSAELSEAINSMYQWYSQATICYAFLSDVDDEIADSRWFTRGWTLQELIAPYDVDFYDRSWQLLGSKRRTIELALMVSQVTGIDMSVLLGDLPLDEVSVSTRMKWAGKRQTTRSEDIAYSLLGIFGVNMPLLYGEGTRAFLRLQEEILKVTDDQTIFAWRSTDWDPDEISGMLASSPSCFGGPSDYHPLPPLLSSKSEPWSTTNQGLRLQLNLCHIKSPRFPNDFVARLDCSIHSARNIERQGDKVVGIILRRLWGDQYARVRAQEVVHMEDSLEDVTTWSWRLAGAHGEAPRNLGSSLEEPQVQTVFVRHRPFYLAPDFVIDQSHFAKEADCRFIDIYPKRQWRERLALIRSTNTLTNGIVAVIRFAGTKSREIFDLAIAFERSQGHDWVEHSLPFKADPVLPLETVFQHVDNSWRRSTRDRYAARELLSISPFTSVHRPTITRVERLGRSYLNICIQPNLELPATTGLDRGPLIPPNPPSTASMPETLSATIRLLTQSSIHHISVQELAFPPETFPQLVRRRPTNLIPNWPTNLIPNWPIDNRWTETAEPLSPRSDTGTDGSATDNMDVEFVDACRRRDARDVTTIVLRCSGERSVFRGELSGPELSPEALEYVSDFHGFFPVHWLSMSTSVAALRFLWGNVVRNPITQEGLTTLHLAALFSKTCREIFGYLVRTGKDLEYTHQRCQGAGDTALHLAVVCRPPHIFKDCLEEVRFVFGSAPRRYFRNGLGETLLHRAAAVGEKNCMGIVYLDDPQSLTDRDSMDRLPLWHASCAGETEAVELLITWHGKELASQINWPDFNGLTALHAACREGNDSCVDLLLRHGADWKATTVHPGFTAAHLATLFGHTRCIELIVGYEIQTNTLGTTGLEEAEDSTDSLFWNTNWDMSASGLQKAIRLAEEVTAVGESDEQLTFAEKQLTLLHTAAANGYGDIVGLLLQSQVEDPAARTSHFLKLDKSSGEVTLEHAGDATADVIAEEEGHFDIAEMIRASRSGRQ